MLAHPRFHHKTDLSLEQLLQQSDVDCLVADCEDGFSQLGQARRWLSDELGYPDTSLNRWLIPGYPDRLEPSIGQLADWCRARSPEITLAVLPARRLQARLKGLILSPYDGSECYRPFGNGHRSSPHADFMYSVAWAALYQAVHRLEARHPALMHPSRSRTAGNKFRWDITRCQVEAALNFHDAYARPESLTFWDLFPGNPVDSAVQYFEGGQPRSHHRPFTHFSTQQWGIHFVTIQWQGARQQKVF